MSSAPLHRAERHVIRELRRAGATSAAGAYVFPSLRRLERNRLARLVDVGVVRQSDGGGYYLDPDALDDYQARRRQIAAIAVIAALILVVVTFVLSRRPH